MADKISEENRMLHSKGNTRLPPPSGQGDAMETKRKSLQDTEQEPLRKRPVSSASEGKTSAPKFSMGLGSKAANPAGMTSNNDKPKSSLSFGLMKPKASPAPIKMLLGGQKPAREITKPKAAVSAASAFNQDDDSEEEEMPPEAKMRMKNIGRETPTAAGPNSYGKNKLGFCDRNKIIERELTELASKDDKPS